MAAIRSKRIENLKELGEGYGVEDREPEGDQRSEHSLRAGLRGGDASLKPQEADR